MKTKTILLALFFAIFSSLSFAQPVPPGEASDSLAATGNKASFSGYAEMNYYRHYLWRGALWGSNDVSQPELHLEFGKFWVGAYSNLNLLPRNLPSEYYKNKVVFDEQDFEIGYQDELGDLQFQASVAGYFYFSQLETPNTGELLLNLYYPAWKNTQFFSESGLDIASYRGAFFTAAGLQYQKELDAFSIEGRLFGGLANSRFNSTYYGVEGTRLDFVGANIYLQYSLRNNLYVAANVEYNRYTDREIRAITGLDKTDNLSLHVGIEF